MAAPENVELNKITARELLDLLKSKPGRVDAEGCRLRSWPSTVAAGAAEADGKLDL